MIRGRQTGTQNRPAATYETAEQPRLDSMYRKATMSKKLWTALGTGAALMIGTLTLVPDAAIGDQAVTTRVMVRAIAKDAKVIGDGVGGAVIRIRDVETGQLLAEGVQKGGTGNTQAIMMDARSRGLTAFGADPKAAGFLAELSLSEPTLVDISAQ